MLRSLAVWLLTFGLFLVAYDTVTQSGAPASGTAVHSMEGGDGMPPPSRH
jgi:hypothetical protein